MTCKHACKVVIIFISVAAIPASGICGGLVLIAVAHHIGRKKPMIFIGINAFGGFTILFFSRNVQHLIYCQILEGVTQAASMTLSVMAILEYTVPKYRGLFMGIKMATTIWGLWVANAVGTFTSYRYVGLLGMICAGYASLAACFIPESPYWLACQKKYDECATAFRFMRGADDGVENELNLLLNTQKEINDTDKKQSFKMFVKNVVEVLKKPEIYKPMLLVALVFMANQFSGKTLCNAYAVQMLSKITKTENAAYTAMLILDGFSVISLYTGCVLVKFFKRRMLLIGGSSMCAVFLVSLSLYLYLVKLNTIVENDYVIVALLIGYTISACIGPIILTNVLIGELIPEKHRTISITLLNIIIKLNLVLSLKTGIYIFSYFRVHGAFLFFSIGLILCLFLVYLYIPETKDRTAEETYFFNDLSTYRFISK